MVLHHEWKRPRAARVALLAVCAALPLSGCGGIQDNVAHSVAAAPLDLDATFGGNEGAYCNAVAAGWQSGQKAPAPTGATLPAPTVACAQTVVHDSLVKCHAFMNSVVGDQVGWDVGLDVAGLAGSAVGAVVSPASIARGFSAASSIFTGSRAAIDSDIYAKAGRGAFSTAIQATYYKSMVALMTQLKTQSEGEQAARTAIDTAEVYHASCTLDSAESSISSTLANATINKTTPPAPGGKDVVPGAGVAKPGGKKAPAREKVAQEALTAPKAQPTACDANVALPGSAITPPCN